MSHHPFKPPFKQIKQKKEPDQFPSITEKVARAGPYTDSMIYGSFPKRRGHLRAHKQLNCCDRNKGHRQSHPLSEANDHTMVKASLIKPTSLSFKPAVVDRWSANIESYLLTRVLLVQQGNQ